MAGDGRQRVEESVAILAQAILAQGYSEVSVGAGVNSFQGLGHVHGTIGGVVSRLACASPFEEWLAVILGLWSES